MSTGVMKLKTNVGKTHQESPGIMFDKHSSRLSWILFNIQFKNFTKENHLGQLN